MKKGFIIIAGMLLMLMADAQVILKTIVTQGPVIVGEPFQVQYVLEEADQDADFFQPDFKQFRFISGPNIYGGVSYGTDGPKRLKNIAFTLVAPKDGRYIVPGASIKLHGTIFRSQPATLEVISKATAIKRGMLADKPVYVADSYLQPGEDPYEKIRHNLFMKVSVDKRSCTVGQPVTATFKLYSRLNSKSDIVKNPGFYGFAIQDMVNLADNVSATETLNGKKFEVHTVRKVQLYPLQAGVLTIDPMEVQNKVEFATSAVSKKTEQEITEGVMPSEDELFSTPGFKVCETTMHTEPVTIKVDPLPEQGRPDDFNGATGRFTLSASLAKNELGVNEEGQLEITIAGKGNFMQLGPPVIHWPKRLEGFAPDVKDSLNKNVSPLEGKRVFQFRFVSTHAGSYDIPPISFSFFDPDSNRYKTSSAKAITVSVTGASAKQAPGLDGPSRNFDKKMPFIWIGLAAILITVFALIAKRRRDKQPMLSASGEPASSNKPSVTELLQPASVLVEAEDNSFYAALRSAIWQFGSTRFNLSGSAMNRFSLSQALALNNVDALDQQSLLRVLDACDEGLFTGAVAAGDKKILLEQTRELLLKIL